MVASLTLQAHVVLPWRPPAKQKDTMDVRRAFAEIVAGNRDRHAALRELLAEVLRAAAASPDGQAHFAAFLDCYIRWPGMACLGGPGTGSADVALCS